MKTLYHWGFVLTLTVLPTMTTHAESREALLHSSYKMVMVFDELSPISLPEEAWVPYSICLIERLNSLDSESLSEESLVRYIRVFDSNVYFPADLALMLDTEVIDPCMQHNPIVSLSSGSRYGQ